MFYFLHKEDLRTFLLPLASCSLLIFLASCSVQKQIAKSAKENVLSAPALQTAHVGISIYEPETNRYWFNYQGDKYFVPASNTKIPTCYAAMKYLGDSLVAAYYTDDGEIVVSPNGDPTFLLPEYSYQPLFDFLKTNKVVRICPPIFKTTLLGSGWSWNDYSENYMAERSSMPIYGNIFRLSFIKDSLVIIPTPKPFYLLPGQEYLFARKTDGGKTISNNELNKSFYSIPFTIQRKINDNIFEVQRGNSFPSSFEIPIKTDAQYDNYSFLKDTLGNPGLIISTYCSQFDRNHQTYQYSLKKTIHSQPTDSLLKPMMHRSDNFFAEQSLLMVSNERLGIMNDEKIIDTLLKTDFKDLPQKPRWVDGSGLSRYNLFTPQDFVTILNKMKNEFGMERIKVVLPTGGEGTISNYYNTESGYIYAKTGTLSGVVALSGFLYTKKNKLLIVSILVNNHNGSATDVRRAVEKFLQQLRNKY
jgi:serine-type D-Ala-D-Ala carboxypeptidase/endopeptidase (penicillin-binding protein 4)